MRAQLLIDQAEHYKINGEIDEAVRLWNQVIDECPDTDQSIYANDQLKMHISDKAYTGKRKASTIFIFIPTFVAVMIFNQMFYGACFKAYCLSAALPKVTILALAISIFIYYITKQEDEDTSDK